MVIVKESAPHLRRKETVSSMMLDVLIALAPTLIFAFVVYPVRTAIFWSISLAVMYLCEFVNIGLRNMMPADGQKHSFKERFIYAYKGKIDKSNLLATAITATIFTLVLPAGAPIYAVVLGALFGIVFGKLVFGGLGQNIFNPAVVGMLFAKLCFGSQYATATSNWFVNIPDAVAGATPLGYINGGMFSGYSQYSLLDMFLGRIPGTLGEVYKITILAGLVYLLIKRAVDFRIVVSYLGTCFILALVAGLSLHSLNGDINPLTFTIYNILSGGLLFGAVFMLTDPVTSPINSPSRIMYGMIAAVVTIFIRFFAALPEGVGFSILFANMIAAVLDHYEWSNPRYTWKNILAMSLIVVISSLTVFLVMRFGGVYNG